MLPRNHQDYNSSIFFQYEDVRRLHPWPLFPSNDGASLSTASSSGDGSSFSCDVCGDQAPHHVHYGGIACFSCRAFFRRSVSKWQNYRCSNSGHPPQTLCKITVETRRACQYCRYQCCLLAGMRETWVLSDDERIARKLRRKPPSLTTTLYSLSRELDELLLMEQSVRENLPLTPLLAQEIEECSLNENNKLSHDSVLKLHHLAYSRLVEFVGNIAIFQSLPIDAKRTLLRDNLDALKSIRLSYAFNSDGSGHRERQQLLLGQRYVKLHNALELPQMFFEPWAEDEEYLRLYGKTVKNLARLLDGDIRLVILYQLVVLFNSTYHGIELRQEKLALTLQKFLIEKHGPLVGVLIFSKMLVIIADLNHLSQMMCS